MTTLDQAIADLNLVLSNFRQWENCDNDRRNATLSIANQLINDPRLTHPHKQQLRGEILRVQSLVEVQQ